MPKITKVSWNDVWASNVALVANWDEPDAIVGISRGGVPIAVHLSYLAPQVPVYYASRVGPIARSDNKPFYIFDGRSGERLVRKPKEFNLPEIHGPPERVLVVDDVATFGGTLDVVSTKLRRLHPSVAISFYCYAVDRLRLDETRPWISELTASHLTVNNRTTWLNFPWQLRDKIV